MGILSLFAILTGRKAVSLYILFTSFIITTIFSPQSLGSISFQLSYAATLGIILFSRTTKVKEGWIGKTVLLHQSSLRLSG
jgi:predicted membrane metal-binding protein